MLRFRSYVQRLMVMLAVCVIIIATSACLLSTMLVRNSYVGMSRREMEQSVQQGLSFLDSFARGEITREELNASVNPTLNLTGVYMMLMDEGGQILCLSLIHI